MNLFSSIRAKRRTAFAMLLVWLFALGSAWANACLLQDSRVHLHESTHGSTHGSNDGEPVVAHAPLVSPAHLGADAVHPENAGAAKGACLKVCGDGAQTIVKLTSSVDLADAAMAPPVALPWTARHDAAPHGNDWLELPAPSPGLPLRIRYSRLTL